MLDGVDSFGAMTRFFLRVMRGVFSGQVFRFFGEVLRQAGILILGSVGIILLLVFILGLQCGIEGTYGSESIGSPSVSGAFTALCDLREVTPYAFGYMMAAKVGTGFVAELGSMSISDEIDALEVMGLDSLLYLCSTRLLAMWLVLPFVYLAAITSGFFASYLAVVVQIGKVSAGGYFQIFWQFQNPLDLVYSAIKAMTMATFVVLVGVYYGFTASGGPVGVGAATARSMVVNIIGIHTIGLVGTQLFWGGNARAPIGG
jgi:phospholipid/cholesterol/gamma-HCH transport system permease protein